MCSPSPSLTLTLLLHGVHQVLHRGTPPSFLPVCPPNQSLSRPPTVSLLPRMPPRLASQGGSRYGRAPTRSTSCRCAGCGSTRASQAPWWCCRSREPVSSSGAPSLPARACTTSWRCACCVRHSPSSTPRPLAACSTASARTSPWWTICCRSPPLTPSKPASRFWLRLSWWRLRCRSCCPCSCRWPLRSTCCARATFAPAARSNDSRQSHAAPCLRLSVRPSRACPRSARSPRSAASGTPSWTRSSATASGSMRSSAPRAGWASDSTSSPRQRCWRPACSPWRCTRQLRRISWRWRSPTRCNSLG
mmetsp:Transcript_26146/g.77564  ORF Transcript_26146/g.77564 Transcript_26146/m.77564 type:complete len:305 (-) Transcript_26146:2454-3368(-)